MHEEVVTSDVCNVLQSNMLEYSDYIFVVTFNVTREFRELSHQ